MLTPGRGAPEAVSVAVMMQVNWAHVHGGQTDGARFVSRVSVCVCGRGRPVPAANTLRSSAVVQRRQCERNLSAKQLQCAWPAQELKLRLNVLTWLRLLVFDPVQATVTCLTSMHQHQHNSRRQKPSTLVSAALTGVDGAPVRGTRAEMRPPQPAGFLTHPVRPGVSLPAGASPGWRPQDALTGVDGAWVGGDMSPLDG